MDNLIVIPCLLFGLLMGLLLAWTWPRIEGWWMTFRSDREARRRLRLPPQSFPKKDRRRLFPQIRFPR